MKKHLLALVTDKDHGQVFIHADATGIDILIKELENIRDGLAKNDCLHAHLFSQEWGTGELSISTLLDKEEGMPVHHLKILGWNEEWVEKHGFKRS